MNVEEKRVARELCLQLMFQHEFVDQIILNKASISKFDTELTLNDFIIKKAMSFVKGIQENQKEIDLLIEEASKHWRISRMPLVDINIMRLSIYEFRFQNNPISPAIAINESLEISKKYSSKDSVQFINGVLDKVKS